MNSKLLLSIAFCAIIAQNFAHGSFQQDEFNLFDANNQQPNISNQSFRKTPPVAKLNLERLHKGDLFYMDEIDEENLTSDLTPTPASSSLTNQYTPSTPNVFSSLTAHELAALIASRSTPEEIYKKSRRRDSSVLLTSVIPHGQS